MSNELNNRALLIRKEDLPKYFKLTFSSKTGKEYFLTLHKDKKGIYQQLAVNQYYFYQRKKGLKYSFITSINQPITTEQQELINKRNTELKLSFIQQIAKDLKKGSFQKRDIIKKLEKLKEKIIQLKSSESNVEYLLDWVEDLLTAYWLQLKEQVPNQMTIISKRIERMISKLSALFLSDYLYDSSCKWISKKNVFCPNCWKKQEDYLSEMKRTLLRE